jgi:hypothetical protein
MHHIACHKSELPGSATAGMFLTLQALYFSSTSVENLTSPFSKISTRGAVPRIPIVPMGVSTFMLPVCATLPAMKVNVPLVRLSRVEFELPFGS